MVLRARVWPGRDGDLIDEVLREGDKDGVTREVEAVDCPAVHTEDGELVFADRADVEDSTREEAKCNPRSGGVREGRPALPRCGTAGSSSNAAPSRTCSLSRAEGIAIAAASGTRAFRFATWLCSSSTSGETTTTYWS